MNETPLITPRPALNVGAVVGAREFYWVAGLSLVNSVLAHTGANIRFPIGLGITQFMDGVAIGLHESMGGIAVGIAIFFDLFTAGVCALFGWLTGRGMKAVLVIGMILYALDGLLCLMFGDWLSAGFHAFILYKFFQAVKNFA